MISFQPLFTQKNILVELQKKRENSPWPRFLEDFISIKLNFSPKTDSQERGALHKRELEKHYACKWLEWMSFMHMYMRSERESFLIEFKTCENDPLFCTS